MKPDGQVVCQVLKNSSEAFRTLSYRQMRYEVTQWLDPVKRCCSRPQVGIFIYTEVATKGDTNSSNVLDSIIIAEARDELWTSRGGFQQRIDRCNKKCT